MHADAEVDGKKLVLSGVILSKSGGQVKLNAVESGYTTFKLVASFTEVEKASEKPVRIEVLNNEIVHLGLEVIREKPGSIDEPIQVAERSDGARLFISFRVDTSFNGQVQFTYNLYVDEETRHKNEEERTRTKVTTKRKTKTGGRKGK